MSRKESRPARTNRARSPIDIGIDRLRSTIDGITKYILWHYAPARKVYRRLSATLEKRDAETREHCKAQRIKNVGDFLIHNKVTAELYKRIGNQILKSALNVKIRHERERKAREPNSTPARRRIARRELLCSIEKCLRLKAIAEAECLNDFAEYINRLEEAKSYAIYERDQPQNKKEELCMD